MEAAAAGKSVLGAELLDVPAVVGEGEILLPVNAVREHLDSQPVLGRRGRAFNHYDKRPGYTDEVSSLQPI